VVSCAIGFFTQPALKNNVSRRKTRVQIEVGKRREDEGGR
jgi:hypothetical protein